MKKILILTLMITGLAAPSWAENKSWNAEGDATDWFDDANWMVAGKPSAADNAKVDMRDAQVEVGQSFAAKSLTLGGKKNSSLDVSNFVNATIAPSADTDDAVTNRRDGKLTLKGSAGKITLKGAYKDSEEVIPDEPSFILYVK